MRDDVAIKRRLLLAERLHRMTPAIWHQSNTPLYVTAKINAIYRQTSNISRILVGNIIVNNSDVVEASPVGAAPTTSSLST